MQRTIVSVCLVGLIPGALLAQEPEAELGLEPVTLAADSLRGPVRSVEWRITIPGEEDRVIRTSYDRQGRRIEREHVEGGVGIQRWLYRYDEQGRRSGMELASHVSSSGETSLHHHAFVYDAQGRVTARLFHSPGAPEPGRHRYGRDEHGRLVEVDYGRSGRKEYRYDAAGARVLEAYFVAAAHGYGRHELSCDSAGWPIEWRARSDELRWVVRSRYDSMGRLIERHTCSDVMQWVVRSRYDAEGRLEEAVTEILADDPQVSSSHEPVPGREVYTWSDGGRTKETTSYAPDGALRNRLVQRWDARGRMVEYAENGRGTVRWEYEDDHWGNWTRQCHLWSPPGGDRVVSTCMTRAITYW